MTAFPRGFGAAHQVIITLRRCYRGGVRISWLTSSSSEEKKENSEDLYLVLWPNNEAICYMDFLPSSVRFLLHNPQDCPAVSSIQVSSTLILHTFLLPPHIQNVMTNITAALSNVLNRGASSEARRAAAVCCLTSLLYVNASRRGQWKHGSVRFSLSLSGCVWFSRLAHKASM